VSGFGSGPWGAIPWGDGGAGSIQLLAALAVRENVVRLTFDQAIYLSHLLDRFDASAPSHYVLSPDPTSVGADGTPARAVMAVTADFARDGTGALLGGDSIIDIVLDRPMTPWPARYLIQVVDLLSADFLNVITTTIIGFDAVYKQLSPPTLEVAVPTRDIANPQTRQALLDPVPDPNDPLNLGTFVVDDTGDLAFDEGLTSLKKRILRRLVTSPGRFAHLPGYGVGIPDHGKRLAQAAVIAQLSASAEAQIALEPEVAKVKVRPVLDVNNPGLVRFRILVRTKTGAAQRLDVPFEAA